MKFAYVVIGVFILAGLGFVLYSPSHTPVVSEAVSESQEVSGDMVTTEQSVESENSVVTEGSYAVDTENSVVYWAGQKPLIDGYVNSGSIAMREGSIEVLAGAATGEFVIDMNTMSVSATPAKPGQESTLESHLKGERWFGVDAYPTATFVITEVAPRADSDSTFMYDITGELTLKDTTDILSFPAKIYLDGDGRLHAQADFEFDRTVWGITAGSGSFFDNLADNVVSDMVAMSFDVVADAQ